MIKIKKNKRQKHLKIWKKKWNKQRLQEMMKKLEKICLKKNKKCKNILMILSVKRIMIKSNRKKMIFKEKL